MAKGPEHQHIDRDPPSGERNDDVANAEVVQDRRLALIDHMKRIEQLEPLPERATWFFRVTMEEWSEGRLIPEEMLSPLMRGLRKEQEGFQFFLKSKLGELKEISEVIPGRNKNEYKIGRAHV